MDDLVQEIGAAKDAIHLEDVVRAWSVRMGFPLYGYRYGRKQPCSTSIGFFVANTPPAFAEAAIDPTASRRDPVLSLLRRCTMPFAYDQRFYAERGAADLWEQQAPYGYRVGVCSSLRLPNGEDVILGVDREDSISSSEKERQKLIGAVHSAVYYLSLSAPRIYAKELNARCAVTNVDSLLTDRVLQVLFWVAQGRDDAEIGEILQVSTNTVRGHPRTAMEKLGASNRGHAAAEAMRLELLDMRFVYSN